MAVPAGPDGPSREGKGSLYEGGTRVVAFANRSGHIRPGSIVDEMLHVVDMYPTLLRLAGARHDKSKPLDGLDVWDTLSEGKPSPRTEVVYNIPQDPSEKNNLAAQNPEKVSALQKRANELAASMAKSMLLQAEFQAMRQRLAMPPALPDEPFQLEEP